jgi:hypothetical protein
MGVCIQKMVLELYVHLNDSMEDYIAMITCLLDMMHSEDLAMIVD